MEKFHIDAAQLCSRVEVMDAVFNRDPGSGQFLEGATSSMSLPEIAPASFHIFLFWLYQMPEFGAIIFSCGLVTVLGVFLLAEMWMLKGLMQPAFERLFNLAAEAYRHSDLKSDSVMKHALDLARDSNIRFLLIAVHAEFEARFHIGNEDWPHQEHMYVAS